MSGCLVCILLLKCVAQKVGCVVSMHRVDWVFLLTWLSAWQNVVTCCCLVDKALSPCHMPYVSGTVPVRPRQPPSPDVFFVIQEAFHMQFRNKAREKQRQLTLKQRDKTVSKPERVQAASASCPQLSVQKKLPAAKRRRKETQEDDATLVEDYRHLKKLKSGQITQVIISIADKVVDVP